MANTNVVDALVQELLGEGWIGLQINFNGRGLVSGISRVSTAGATQAEIVFNPPLKLQAALVAAQDYTEPGSKFVHGSKDVDCHRVGT